MNTSKFDKRFAHLIARDRLELARLIGSDSFDSLTRLIYRKTESGVNLYPTKTGGFGLSVIVEGTEQEYSTESEFPVPLASFFEMVEDCEEFAANAWNETHGCPTCEAFWESQGVELDGFSCPIYSDCPECKGEGMVI